jgi:methionyl-tRNA synthetase
VLYICGSDEHGAAISIAAEQENTTPQAIIDKYHADNLEAFTKFGMSFDEYSRTSLPTHKETVQEFFLDLLNKGYLTERAEKQFYDEEAQRFLPDRYVEGVCPNCGYDKARGDQCDNCGAYYNQTELKNPISKVTGKAPIVKETTHWYFRLQDFQQFLEEYIEGHAEWKTNVLQQAQSWLKQGLGERAITRDLDWGVPVPLENAEGKKVYVWFDAVLGYITATKEWAKKQTPENPDSWKQWWQSDETNYIAFIGKDNIVFHTLMFPAMLEAKGDFVIPNNVPANEFLNLEGQKFSKSRNWSIDLRDYLKEFPETLHADYLRYVLAVNMPETRDSDFTWNDFQARINNELADKLGNFVNRTLQFLHKYFDGTLPDTGEAFLEEWKQIEAIADEAAQKATVDTSMESIIQQVQSDYKGKSNSGMLNEHGVSVITTLVVGRHTIANCYKKFRFRDAVAETMSLARAANLYFNDTQPWKLIKNDKEACGQVLFTCVQIVQSLAIAFSPILPFTSQRIIQLLSNSANGEESVFLAEQVQWKSIGSVHYTTPLQTAKPEILIRKIEDEDVQRMVEKLQASNNNDDDESIESKPLISFEDFSNVELRTARIVQAEKLKKSKKLMKLQVELAGTTRQIVAGIAHQHKPEDIVGKTVVIVANLKPAKLMGEVSEGMVLAINFGEGKAETILPLVVQDEDVPSGAEVR